MMTMMFGSLFLGVMIDKDQIPFLSPFVRIFVFLLLGVGYVG